MNSDPDATHCEDCRHWELFDMADGGWCPIIVKATDPDDTCPRAFLRTLPKRKEAENEDS